MWLCGMLSASSLQLLEFLFCKVYVNSCMHAIFECTGTRSWSCPFILAAYLATYSPLQHFQLPTAIRLGEAAAGGHEATEVRVREEGMERRQFRGERRPGNAVLL